MITRWLPRTFWRPEHLNALDNEGYTPLHYAAANSGNGRVVARLVSAGADPLAESNDGRTPLHSALRYDAVRDVVPALIQGGGAENLTPLQLGALQGDAAVVTFLLAEGADPNVVDAYGWNSLHFAVPLAGPETVSALLAAGADPNAVAGEEDEEEAGTPLHLATRWNDDSSIVLALLDSGADAAARDGTGRRPVDYARGNDAIIGSAAYPRLLVTQPVSLVASRAVTGNLQPSDGVGGGFGYYDEWVYRSGG